MFIYYFFHISLRTYNHKQEIFEQAWIYVLYFPEIFTNKFAKRSDMDIELFFAGKDLR